MGLLHFYLVSLATLSIRAELESPANLSEFIPFVPRPHRDSFSPCLEEPPTLARRQRGYRATAQARGRPRDAYLGPSAAGHYAQPVPDGGEDRGEVGQAEQDPEPHQRLVGCRVLAGAGAWDTTGEGRKKVTVGQALSLWPLFHCFASLLIERIRPPQGDECVFEFMQGR